VCLALQLTFPRAVCVSKSFYKFSLQCST